MLRHARVDRFTFRVYAQQKEKRPVPNITKKTAIVNFWYSTCLHFVPNSIRSLKLAMQRGGGNQVTWDCKGTIMGRLFVVTKRTLGVEQSSFLQQGKTKYISFSTREQLSHNVQCRIYVPPHWVTLDLVWHLQHLLELQVIYTFFPKRNLVDIWHKFTWSLEREFSPNIVMCVVSNEKCRLIHAF